MGSGVISPFSYTKLETLHATEMEYFTYLNPYNANLWILFINKGPQTCHIKSSLGQDSKYLHKFSFIGSITRHNYCCGSGDSSCAYFWYYFYDTKKKTIGWESWTNITIKRH